MKICPLRQQPCSKSCELYAPLSGSYTTHCALSRIVESIKDLTHAIENSHS